MKGVGFKNGYGNAVIATSIWQALASISEGNQIDLLLDSDWKDRGPIELMAQKMPFVRKVVLFPEEFDQNEYHQIYMSFHGIWHSQVSEYIHGRKRLDISNYTCWSTSFQSELSFLYEELRKQFKYRGRIFPQYMPVADKLSIELPPGPKIVFANGYARTSNDDWRRKQWPYFAELGKEIVDFYPNATVYLVGGHEDWEWAEGVCQKVGTHANFFNMAGLLDITETAKLIKESQYFIGNDSVAFHIADALRKPGVALFASTLVSKNGPLNGTVECVRSPLRCAPCQASVQFTSCEAPEKCMESISVGQIMAIMRRNFLTSNNS